MANVQQQDIQQANEAELLLAEYDEAVSTVIVFETIGLGRVLSADEVDDRESAFSRIREIEQSRDHVNIMSTARNRRVVMKFQMTGRLFVLDPEQRQFVHRGDGFFKIKEIRDQSDSEILRMRLIMRLNEAFVVILNSPLIPEMTVERATDQSVTFSAVNQAGLQLFKIEGSTNDCANLYEELRSRIEIVKRQQGSSSTGSSLIATAFNSLPDGTRE